MNRLQGLRLAGLPLFLACHPSPPDATATASHTGCAPAAGELPRDASAAGLAGAYRLRIVATGGPDSGASASGHLELRVWPDSLQIAPPVLGIVDTTTRLPLSGTLELDPRAIGARNTGDLRSTDPNAPGVLLIERHPARPDAPMSLMLRFGADANRRGVVRYDGGYFALSVRRLEPDGFRGTWASGALGPTASGYFCAERATQ